MGYDTLSLSNQLLALRDNAVVSSSDNAVVSSSRAEMSNNILTLEYVIIMLFQNVMNQLITDVASFARRRDS